MNAAPIISIVSPSYLTAGYLPAMVGSLISQSETRWELIIVDDAKLERRLDCIFEPLETAVAASPMWASVDDFLRVATGQPL